MPISLPLGTSETFVVSSCRDVRGEPTPKGVVSMLGVLVKTMSVGCLPTGDRSQVYNFTKTIGLYVHNTTANKLLYNQEQGALP